MIILFYNATFAKIAYVGKIIYGVMTFQANKWLVPGMVGIEEVVVRK